MSTYRSDLFGQTTLALLKRVLALGERDTGDLWRNAALYLAKRASSRRSSFEISFDPIVDAARLGEVPYLASLGFLSAAGVLEAQQVGVARALRAIAQRASHTAERSGYADDSICSCGLLLLATAYQEQALARFLRESLEEATVSDAAVALLVSASLDASIPVQAPDPNSTDHLAAALLWRHIQKGGVGSPFLGFPADLEGHFLASFALSSYSPRADLAAMLVLVALETVLYLPDLGLPSEEGGCDVGVIIALKEEFRVLFARFEHRHLEVRHEGRTYYLFDVPGLGLARPYRCVATLVGEMGTDRTGQAAAKVLSRWDPQTLALIGIAGGIHSDVLLGDVVVASEVNAYLAGAKTVDDPGGAIFLRSNDAFKASFALHERVKNFEFANRAAFLTWQRLCRERRSGLGSVAETETMSDLIRNQPLQLEGHLASGPFVVTSKEFVKWIQAGDRACLGVEMEASGLMIAAHTDPTQRQVIVIRGISDFADERKSLLDRSGGGIFRAFAMENAIEFLWTLMAAGVVPQASGEVL